MLAKQAGFFVDAQGFANGNGVSHARLRSVGGYNYQLAQVLNSFNKRFDAWGVDTVVVAN
jgi:hypothetical protein